MLTHTQTHNIWFDRHKHTYIILFTTNCMRPILKYICFMVWYICESSDWPLCIRRCICHWFIWNVSVCYFYLNLFKRNFTATKIQRNKILLTKSKFSFFSPLQLSLALRPRYSIKKNYIKLHHDTHNLKEKKDKKKYNTKHNF